MNEHNHLTVSSVAACHLASDCSHRNISDQNYDVVVRSRPLRSLLGRSRCHGDQRRGATMALMAVMLPVVLAVAAYAINVVYIETTRTELQITTDIATRAAGRTLAVTGSQEQALVQANRLLAVNPYANQEITIEGTESLFGSSTRMSENERYAFKPSSKPNAVRLESFGNAEIPMLFPTMGVPITFRPIKAAICTQIEMDIALVLDRSGSMAYSSTEDSNTGLPPATNPAWRSNDPVPPQARWLDTVVAIDGFLKIMDETSHDERVTLNTYNQKSQTDVKLTGDYATIHQSMADHSYSFEGGATNIGDGILEGAAALSDKKLGRKWAARVLIVLSDGNHNTGTDPIYAASLVAGQKIMIYTVTFSDEANQTQMKEVAGIGGGQHYHAVTSQTLADAFVDIARSLPTLITF